MDVLLIRHAEAADRDGWTGPDAERPLTPAGRTQIRGLADWLLARAAAPDILVLSPLLRARQTGEELVKVWPLAPEAVLVRDELAPDRKPKHVGRMLAGVSKAGRRVAVVGHEPDLGKFAAWLVGGKRARLEFAKGGAALIVVDAPMGRGAGTLRWLVAPGLVTA